MQSWMVLLTFKKALDADAMRLVPQERAHVDQLMREGKILSRYIAGDNSRIWLVFSSPTKAELEALIETLPMHTYFNTEITPVNA